jgi:hypothetical protein
MIKDVQPNHYLRPPIRITIEISKFLFKNIRLIIRRILEKIQKNLLPFHFSIIKGLIPLINPQKKTLIPSKFAKNGYIN